MFEMGKPFGPRWQVIKSLLGGNPHPTPSITDQGPNVAFTQAVWYFFIMAEIFKTLGGRVKYRDTIIQGAYPKPPVRCRI